MNYLLEIPNNIDQKLSYHSTTIACFFKIKG